MDGTGTLINLGYRSVLFFFQLPSVSCCLVSRLCSVPSFRLGSRVVEGNTAAVVRLFPQADRQCKYPMDSSGVVVVVEVVNPESKLQYGKRR